MRAVLSLLVVAVTAAFRTDFKRNTSILDSSILRTEAHWGDEVPGLIGGTCNRPCAGSAYELIVSSLHKTVGDHVLKHLRRASQNGNLNDQLAAKLFDAPSPRQQPPIATMIHKNIARYVSKSGCAARAVWNAVKAQLSPESFAVVAAALSLRQNEIQKNGPFLEDALILGQLMSAKFVNNEYKGSPQRIQKCAPWASKRLGATWPCFFGEATIGIDLKKINEGIQSSIVTSWASQGFFHNKC